MLSNSASSAIWYFLLFVYSVAISMFTAILAHQIAAGLILGSYIYNRWYWPSYLTFGVAAAFVYLPVFQWVRDRLNGTCPRSLFALAGLLLAIVPALFHGERSSNADVLEQAQERGAITEAARDFATALRGADLVYIALPFGLTLESLPALARHAEADTLLTDACSTKTAVCHAAAGLFKGEARFLGGHPMAGKEVSGIEHADAELFRGAKYVLVARVDDPDARVQNFAVLLRRLAAEPMWLDAETHDWAAAIVSPLPQLVAIALACVVRDETDETGLPASLGGRGLRDMLRLMGEEGGQRQAVQRALQLPCPSPGGARHVVVRIPFIAGVVPDLGDAVEKLAIPFRVARNGDVVGIVGRENGGTERLGALEQAIWPAYKPRRVIVGVTRALLGPDELHAPTGEPSESICTDLVPVWYDEFGYGDVAIGVPLRGESVILGKNAIRQVHEGAIGSLVLAEAFYPWSGGGRGEPPKTAEEKLRNWYYVLPLSGDFIVEQSIHSLDVATWIINADPIRARGTGGHKVRPAQSIYDHFAITYEFPNNLTLAFTCIQSIPFVKDEIRARVFGADGVIDVDYHAYRAERTPGSPPSASTDRRSRPPRTAP